VCSFGTTAEIGLGTMIGSNGDNEIIPCAGSRSEIAGADVERTCATWEIKVCGTKQPIGTSSLGGSDADL
jgi:purine nucleoside phosphorylase